MEKKSVSRETLSSPSVVAGLHAVQVVNPRQVELMRQVRNICRGTYAYDNTEISPHEQRAWWRNNRSRVRAYLYYEQGAVLIGFGLLRIESDLRWWDSLGVLPVYRGHGYGSAITTDLALRAAGQVWSSVLASNVPAQRMHRPELWEEVKRDGRLVVYRTRLDKWETSPTPTPTPTQLSLSPTSP